MKKMIVIAVLVMGLVGGKVFAAGDEKVSRHAMETLNKEFPDAEFTKWEKVKNSDVYSARFVYDSQAIVAYINEGGTLIATVRFVKNENLPYRVSQVIRDKYSDQQILKIEELTMDGSLSYIFTIEKNGATTVLRVYHDGAVQKIREEKRKISKNQ